MKILALDTTSEFGSVAVRSAERIVAEESIHSPDGFAHLIFPAVEKLLSGASLDLTDIDCFAAASGPGSFTGVRVGLTAAKGLAEALGKQALGVSNLRALASLGSAPRRAVLIDARRGEVYAAVYDSNLQPITPEAVVKLPDWLKTLQGANYEFISSLPRTLIEGTRFANMLYTRPPNALAPAVACCAAQSRWEDPAVLDANYVRRSDAELFWKEK